MPKGGEGTRGGRCCPQAIQLPSPEISTGIGNLSLRTRSYLSPVLLYSAARLARSSACIEGQATGTGTSDVFLPHRADVIGAIVSAVSFLEATINEFFVDVHDGYLAHTPTLQGSAIPRLKSVWGFNGVGRMSVLDKYDLALVLTEEKQFDHALTPYQDVHVLIELRNAVVHYKPEWAPAGVEEQRELPKGLPRKLKGKFEANPLTGKGNPYYPDKVFGSGCAMWGVQSVVAFANEFNNRLGLEAHYKDILTELQLP